MMKKVLFFYVSILFIFILLNTNHSKADVFYQPQNLDFELGEVGTMPYGWKFDKDARENLLVGGIDTVEFNSGLKSFAIINTQYGNKEISGSLFQSFDASEYRGKKVRLRVAIKTNFQNESSKAYLWLKDYYNKVEYRNFSVSKESIKSQFWDYFELETTIANDAKRINLGIMLVGAGQVNIDDISFTEIKNGISFNNPPKELENNELKKLIDLSQLYGIAKYYSPTFEATKTDWDDLLYNSINSTLKTKNDDQLIDTLSYYFKSINPGIIISKDSIITPKKEKIDKPFPSKLIFKHTGAYSKLANSLFNSEIKDFYLPNRKYEGSIYQSIKTKKYAGKKIRFSAQVKTDLINDHSNAQLWLRVVSEGKTKDINVNMMDNPIQSNKWNKYSIECDLPKSAIKIVVALVMFGEGNVWFDNLNLEYQQNGKFLPIKLLNTNFESVTFNKENKEIEVNDWSLSAKSRSVGYLLNADNKEKFEGKYSLHISTDHSGRVIYPEDDAYFQYTKNKINYRIPYVIDTDKKGYSFPKNPNFDEFTKNLTKIEYSDNDRISRLAVVIDLWNYIKHFNINDLSDVRLQNTLIDGLNKASITKNKFEFNSVLRNILAKLDDSGSRIWKGNNEKYFALPINWKWINNNLIVSNKTPNVPEIEIGDEILEINKTKSDLYLKQFEEQISASAQAWKQLRALALMRIGKKNENVGLLIRKPDGSKINLNLKYSVNPLLPKEPSPIDLSELEGGILYANLTLLDDKDFKKNLQLFQNYNKIIFDLRGTALVSEHILGFFIDSTIKANQWKINIYTGPEEKQRSINFRTSEIQPLDSKLTKNCVFLINEKTIGYAEIIANTIKHYKLFPLIGQETAGGFGDAMSFKLAGNYYFSMTIWDCYGPDGKRLNQNPIQPDIKIADVKPRKVSGSEQIDPQLQMALKLLQDPKNK